MKKIRELESRLKMVSGAEKVKILTELGERCRYQSPEQALEYGKQALNLAKEIHDEKQEANALHCMGAAYLDLCDYDQALEYCLKSLELREKINHKRGTASTFNMIGNIYYLLGNYQKAVEYYQQSLKFAQEVDAKMIVLSSLGNMGGIYKISKDYNRSLENYQKSLKMAEEIGNRDAIARILNNIGSIHHALNEHDQALDYYLRSLRIKEELEDRNGVANTLNNIGHVHAKLEQYDQALSYLKRGLDVAHELEEKSLVRDNYHTQYETYAKMGDYENALKYFESFVQTKDEIINIQTNEKIAEIQTKYETEKKANENEVYRLKLEAQQQLIMAHARRIEEEKLATLGKLAGMVAHELNNCFSGMIVPLEQITNQSRLDKEEIWSCWESDEDGHRLNTYLSKREQELEQTGHAAKMIEASLKRAQLVVEDLGKLVGERSRAVKPVNLVDVFTEICRLYHRQFEHIQIIEDFESDNLTITVSGSEIGQIFIALLTNAADAVKKQSDPTIKISMREKNRGVEIKINDNGIGIPLENQEKLFEPFFTTKKVGGSGLGLFTVRQILHAYDATITFESELNVGTTFIVWFPYEERTAMVNRLKVK